MSETNSFLAKVHINNYLSLRDVEFPLKPLTVLVGPNASGKSNVLRALRRVKSLVNAEELPPARLIQDILWAGGENQITLQLNTEVGKIPTLYELGLRVESNDSYITEKLSVRDIQVISSQNGQGQVWDENGKNKTAYTSNKLALKSAGDYGNKPITRDLRQFIMGWKFYNFQPQHMGGRFSRLAEAIFDQIPIFQEPIWLDEDGSTLPNVLSYWYESKPELFGNVSETLASATNLRIDNRKINGRDQLYLLEGYEHPIPFENASDGTMRLIGYYVLLHEPELAPVIAIEEPERNLHPGALRHIADVLEQLAGKTQVIITTHSSQLLDAFGSENFSDWIGVLLLRNCSGLGTDVLNIDEEISGKQREALDGWIADFGIGSAIFDSGILPDGE